MFFKRQKEHVVTLAGLTDLLRPAGYTADSLPDGKVRVTRSGFAALLVEDAPGHFALSDCGLALGSEIAVLTDLGYQKIFLTPSGKRTAALAEHLHALHEFTESLRESLGLTSLYNEGLGTTNEKHLYDRVKDRDSASIPRPWDR